MSDAKEVLGIEFRLGDKLQAVPCSAATRAALNLPDGEYYELSLQGETAIAVVLKGAPRADIAFAIRELSARRAEHQRAAAYWAMKATAEYERIAGEGAPVTIRFFA